MQDEKNAVSHPNPSHTLIFLKIRKSSAALGAPRRLMNHDAGPGERVGNGGTVLGFRPETPAPSCE